MHSPTDNLMEAFSQLSLICVKLTKKKKTQHNKCTKLCAHMHMHEQRHAYTCTHRHTQEMTCTAYPEVGGDFSVHRDLDFPVVALTPAGRADHQIFEGPGLGQRQL